MWRPKYVYTYVYTWYILEDFWMYHSKISGMITMEEFGDTVWCSHHENAWLRKLIHPTLPLYPILNISELSWCFEQQFQGVLKVPSTETPCHRWCLWKDNLTNLTVAPLSGGLGQMEPMNQPVRWLKKNNQNLSVVKNSTVGWWFPRCSTYMFHP